MFSKSLVKGFFKGLRCPSCSLDFSENSFRIMRFDDGLFVVKVSCVSCGKAFGVAFLGLNEDELIKSLKENCVGKNPISFDDVLDAHLFIQNLDENWNKFINKDNKYR